METIKKPEWLKVRYNPDEVKEVSALMSTLGLNTVCKSANCPNIGTCYRHRTATFMILGDKCTRNCRFCNVDHAKAGELMPPDPDEPKKIADAAKTLGLKHVVVTCVTRDDLADGGASVFADVIKEVRKTSPETTVEVLISDLKGDKAALDTVLAAKPDVINHNVETVERLSPVVRPQADYRRSLDVLRYCKEHGSAFIKTSIMLGLGETDAEIETTLSDIYATGCDILAISQYLRPSKDHAPLDRYVTPEQFEEYKKIAEKIGIKYVVSSPLVRSSYLAADALDAVKAKNDLH